MRRWQAGVFGAAMLGLGYLAGSAGLPLSGRVTAQDKNPVDDKIKIAHQALNEAADALKTENRYDAVTSGTNAFLVLAGGGNAREDLNGSNGVDPETFAALYADKAIPEIKDQLSFDDQKRLTFNGKVIQMYSKSRLSQVYAERLRLSGGK
jgi:hypothetical protein